MAARQNSVTERLLDKKSTFQSLNLGLDKRITKGLALKGFIYPTLVQTEAVPLALRGKDLLVRAKTGSGKTIAYALPLLNAILGINTGGVRKPGVKGIVLVPTRELSVQTQEAIGDLCHYCRDVVSILALSHTSMADQAAQLLDQPDILISTPGRLVAHLKAGNVSLKDSLKMLVVDEADLVLSFGGADDIRAIVPHLPKICQSFLMSATLSSELEELKRLVLHSPAILRLEGDDASGRLTQFFVHVPAEDRYLVLYALLRLELISGKALFFVNDVDSCYRLKLFLEQFSIPAAVLNAELPANSRQHILQQFNQGLFDYLIATDESLGVHAGDDSDEEDESGSGLDSEGDGDAATGAGAGAGAGAASDGSGDGSDDDESDSDEGTDDDASASGSASGDDDDDDDNDSSDEAGSGSDAAAADAQEFAKAAKAATKEAERKKRKREHAQKVKDAKSVGKGKGKGKKGSTFKRDADYGVARGIDFKGVTTVVNVDFPPSVNSYTHRVGRTARGGASGAALSFVDPKEQAEALAKVQASQPADDNGAPQPAELPFNIKEVYSFKYRVDSVRRSITRIAIREARLAELKQEMVNSERLKAHFEDNPRDLQVLRHDAALRPAAVRPSLATVPDYLVPDSLKAAAAAAKDSAGGGAWALDDTMGIEDTGRRRGRKRGRRSHGDPLKTFAVNAAAFGAINANPSVLARAGASASNRNKWKARHKKGRFSSHKYKRAEKPQFYRG